MRRRKRPRVPRRTHLEGRSVGPPRDEPAGSRLPRTSKAFARDRPSGPAPPRLLDPPSVTAVLVAALCVLLSTSYRMDDPDVWQHLLVGKAIWQLHSVPATHLWTWPGYGAREVLPSWGFRALLWPFWRLGEVWGLQIWRWLTTLTAFGILWATSRKMGARGLSPLVVLVVCSLTYRLRSQVRPETLVAVLLALELWILESHRREPRPRHGVALVLIAWVWANVHLSYYLGLVLLAIHVLDAWIVSRRTGEARDAGTLGWALLAGTGMSFLNPFGWRALWQPFEYFLVWRHEPIFQTIIELHPVMWGSHWKSGLPLVVVGWPALAIWRARQAGIDVAETLSLAFLTALALSAQRFAGLYVLAAAPYLARDLDAWIGARRWPAWTAGAAARAALASGSCIAAGWLEWARPEYPIAIGFDMAQYPIQACDFMVRSGVRGRGFNPYYLGGYMLWRFWPDRERLPFMDVHQSGSREDRRLYAYAFANLEAWRELDRRHRFDYLLLDGHPEAVRGDRLLDLVDADSSWALVFRDDAAALFVRRDGSLHPVAERFGYRFVPGGDARVPVLLRQCLRDSVARAEVRRETERQIADSPYNARARSILATLDWIGGNWTAARDQLLAALATDPRARGAHQRLGMIALAENQPKEAIRQFKAEQALGFGNAGLDFLIGQAYQRAGDLGRARTAYRRELRLDPSNAAARESLAVLESRLGP